MRDICIKGHSRWCCLSGTNIWGGVEIQHGHDHYELMRLHIYLKLAHLSPQQLFVLIPAGTYMIGLVNVEKREDYEQMPSGGDHDSSMVVARKGRQRQRYENNLRLVSGCIPYRRLNTMEECCINMEKYSKIQVLMVSSPDRDDLVFPKGGWEDDESREEAASREALKEAGVIGVLEDGPIGEWEFRSKSKEKLGGGWCKGFMFALQVTEELHTWPEMDNRIRRWLDIKEALELCRYDWMRDALHTFLAADDDHKEEYYRQMLSVCAAMLM